MGVDQSQSGSGQRQRLKPPSQKLRSSCDRCSNSKVKCGQERPACQRCAAAGVSCSYSVSRRMGKPAQHGRSNGAASRVKNGSRNADSPAQSNDSSKKSAMLNTRESLPQYWSDASTSQISTRQRRTPSSRQSSPNSSPRCEACPDNDMDLEIEQALSSTVTPFVYGYTNQSSEPWLEASYTNDISPMSVDGPLTSGYAATIQPYIPEDVLSAFDTINKHDYHMNDMNFPNLVPSSACCPSTMDLNAASGITAPAGGFALDTAPSVSTTVEVAPSHSIVSAKTRIPCAILATSVLSSLSAHSAFCKAHKDAASLLKVDEILCTARQATASFHTLLQCPCSGDPLNALSLGVIIQKIISCYTTLIKDASAPSAASWLTSTMSVDAPISIGAFRIDAEDEHHIKMQLVYNELRRVSKMIDAFVARFCDEFGCLEGDQILKNPTDADSSRAVHHTIERLLREQLRRNVQDVRFILGQPPHDTNMRIRQ